MHSAALGNSNDLNFLY